MMERYGIRQDSRNLPRTDRDLGHLRREARRTFHRIPVWISPTGECNLELSVRAHDLVMRPLHKLFPPLVRPVDDRYKTS